MSPALVALIINLVQMAIQYAPDIIAEGQLAIRLLQSPTDLTADEQRQIDEALDKINAKLDADIAARG